MIEKSFFIRRLLFIDGNKVMSNRVFFFSTGFENFSAADVHNNINGENYKQLNIQFFFCLFIFQIVQFSRLVFAKFHDYEIMLGNASCLGHSTVKSMTDIVYMTETQFCQQLHKILVENGTTCRKKCLAIWNQPPISSGALLWLFLCLYRRNSKKDGVSC